MVAMKFLFKQLIVVLAVSSTSLINSEFTTYLIASVLIIFLGVPHGSSDPIIYKFLHKSSIKDQVPVSFGLQYLITIILYLALWMLLPKISLLVFLILSFHHFGETQLNYLKTKTSFKYILFSLWGLMLFTILFAPHVDQLQIWLTPITGEIGFYDWFRNNHVLILITSGMLFFVSSFWIDKKVVIKEVLELSLLFFLFRHTDILVGFAVFFCFWHSRDALLYQLKGLNKHDKKISLKQFIRLLLPYSLLSIGVIVGLVAVSFFVQMEISWVIIFFIIIASLTLPHSMLITKFYQRT
jgi:Brp/Blh family beta-carotene 15,15'-monooxygenase